MTDALSTIGRQLPPRFDQLPWDTLRSPYGAMGRLHHAPTSIQTGSKTAVTAGLLASVSLGMTLAPAVSGLVIEDQRDLTMRNYQGASFKVWNRRRLWFWLVPDQCGSGGTIGISATEAEAVRDACSSIEEMTARHPSFRDWRTGIEARAPMRSLNTLAADKLVFGCMDWWMSVAHQLTDKVLTQWAELVLRSS